MTAHLYLHKVLQVEPIATQSPSDVILLEKFTASSTNFLSVIFHTTEEKGLLVYASGEELVIHYIYL